MADQVIIRRAGHQELDTLDASDIPDLSATYATPASVTSAINAVIASAPGALDTLDELAAALGDDANFAATVTSALAGKQPLDSDLTAIAALTTTSYGRAFLALADAAAARSALSLGTLATQSGTFSGTSSGTNTGDQTNISGNAATVTTNANLTGPITSVGNATTIADAELAAIAGLTSAANKGIQFTGAGTAATFDLTTAGKNLLDDADAAAQRTTLGVDSAVTAATYFNWTFLR